MLFFRFTSALFLYAIPFIYLYAQEPSNSETIIIDGVSQTIESDQDKLPSSMEAGVVPLETEKSMIESIASKILQDYENAKQAVDSARENFDKANAAYQEAGEALEKAERAFKEAEQMKLLADAATK